MNPILKLLPYGIVNKKERSKILSLKKFFRNLLPAGIVYAIKEKKSAQKFTVEFLKNNYVSDLTESEKNTILAYLLKLERSFEDVKYLEIGIYSGSTIRFLKENSTKTHFWGIDLFEDFQPDEKNTHLWKNFSIQTVSEVLGMERVTLKKGDSVEVLKGLDKKNQFDIIFIDGNHTYKATKDDFENSIELLKNHGYVIFHNASPGKTLEDRAYIRHDGGPWQLTEELRLESDLTFLYEMDRVRVFQNNQSDR